MYEPVLKRYCSPQVAATSITSSIPTFPNRASTQSETVIEVAPAPPAPPSDIAITSAASTHSTSTLQSSDHIPQPLSRPAPRPQPASEDITNPWLTVTSGSTKVGRKANEVVVSKSSTHAQKSAAALKKDISKTSAVREKEKDDAALEISLDAVMTIHQASSASAPKETALKANTIAAKDASSLAATPSAITPGSPQAEQPGASRESAPIGAVKKSSAAGPPTMAKGSKKATISTVDKAFGDGDEDGSDHDLDERGIPRLALRQRELVARAFAGDNVVEVCRTNRLYIMEK